MSHDPTPSHYDITLGLQILTSGISIMNDILHRSQFLFSNSFTIYTNRENSFRHFLKNCTIYKPNADQQRFTTAEFRTRKISTPLRHAVLSLVILFSNTNVMYSSQLSILLAKLICHKKRGFNFKWRVGCYLKPEVDNASITLSKALKLQ